MSAVLIRIPLQHWSPWKSVRYPATGTLTQRAAHEARLTQSKCSILRICDVCRLSRLYGQSRVAALKSVFVTAYVKTSAAICAVCVPSFDCIRRDGCRRSAGRQCTQPEACVSDVNIVVTARTGTGALRQSSRMLTYAVCLQGHSPRCKSPSSQERHSSS